MLITRSCGPGALAISATGLGPHSHSYSALPGDDPADVAHRRAELGKAIGHELSWVRQVHSATVLETESGGCVAGEGDALIVSPPSSRGIAPAVLTADCVPVLIASESATYRAAIHAGRKGLVARIITETITRLRALSDEPLYAALGPHICARCYEVSPELAAEVAAERSESAATTSWGTPALDLTAMARAELDAAGVPLSDVTPPECTLENPELFSYRRDGTAGRIASCVVAIGDTPSLLPNPLSKAP